MYTYVYIYIYIYICILWKQGVVIYMMLCTSLQYDTTPIHGTALRLHTPLLSIHKSSRPLAWRNGQSPTKTEAKSTNHRPERVFTDVSYIVTGLSFCVVYWLEQVFHRFYYYYIRCYYYYYYYYYN